MRDFRRVRRPASRWPAVAAHRDFSNGFLVAEIVSRYDERLISMHSYDNGSSLPVRKDNWAQLRKVFRKRGFEYTPEEINDIIHRKSGAAVQLLNRLYTFLTDRR